MYSVSDLLFLVAIYAVISYGLQVTNLTGRFTMASAAFAGVGALVRSGLEVTYGWSAFPAFAAAIVSSVLLAFPVAIAAARIKDLYYAIATFAIAMAFVTLGLQLEFTGRAFGLLGMPRHLTATTAVSVALAVFIALAALDLTRVGHRIRAIGDDELAAQAAGISLRKYLVGTFVAGAAISALGGWMYADYFGAVAAPDFGFAMLVEVVAIVLIGGKNSYAGTLLGAVIVVLVPRVVGDCISGVQPTIIYGTILIVVVLLKPEGLIPRIGGLVFAARARRARRGARPVAPVRDG